MKTQFWKLSGGGNDFICFDNRDGTLPESMKSRLAATLCRRGHSIGADGLLFIESSPRADFIMRIFNPDGWEAETCGNASRCVALLTYKLGISPAEMSFETKAGIYKARVTGEFASISMTDPTDMRLNIPFEEEWSPAPVVHFIRIGVPHVVAFVEKLESMDVLTIGKRVRSHHAFQPAGANVNFATPRNKNNIALRTYERGVENETLSCGTGCAATAIIAGYLGLADSPVHMHTRGGTTNIIHFRMADSAKAQATAGKDTHTTELILEGEAHIIFKGEIDVD
ncbi:MAG: diaminopimelate epimerase [Candidatus Sumerlaeota bacterium]|nr:diaminopimelate epimerase [Candidatus Sumerlaeota bacterium]